MSTIRRLPYSRYLELLFLGNTPDDQIRQAFSRKKLPQPSLDELKSWRMTLFKRLPESAQKHYIAIGAKLVDVANPDPPIKEALELLRLDDAITDQENFSIAKGFFDQVDLRVCVFAHILCKQPDEEILKAVTSMTKYPIPVQALVLFKKYYCDMNTMAYEDWKDWIWEVKPVNFFEADIYSSCFSNRFPFDLIRWKIHLKIENADTDEMLKNLTVYFYFKTLETMESGSDADFEMVQSWGDKFIRAYEKHKTIGKGKAEEVGGRSPAEEAIFQLNRVRLKPKNVNELGESVTKTIVPMILPMNDKKSGSND